MEQEENYHPLLYTSWTSTDAINKVINHYGTDLSITKIMLAMQKDRHKKPSQLYYVLLNYYILYTIC